MTLRGKLNLPEYKVVFDGDKGKQYEGNQDLKEKIVDTLSHMALVSCELAGNDEKKAMDIYADMVSMLYKLPMFMSYAPIEGDSKYLPTAFEYFFVYSIARHVQDLTIDKDTPLREVFERLEKFEKADVLKGLVRGYFSSILEIYEALLNTPADTRPGFNFTSLASHVQLTSLTSWLLQPYSIDLNYLRVASLLHDIGKVINPRHHVAEAIDIMREVQNRLESDKSCIKLNKVKDLIASHHGDFESIVSKADRLASSADRLTELVMKALDDVEYGKEVKECFSKSGEESYDCFTRLGKEKYEKVTKEVYKKILSYVIPERIAQNENSRLFPFIPEKVEKVEKRVSLGRLLGYIVYIDLPGIQKFITNFPKLRDMSFASMLVDFMVTVYSFMLLDSEFSKQGKSRLPAEALLSGYGGHSYIVVRSDICPENVNCKERIKGLFKGLKPLRDLDLKLSVSVAEFAYDNYISNYNEVWEKIKESFSEKYLVDFEEEVFSVGLHKTCENCGVRPATKEFPDIDGYKLLCDRCYEIRQLSKNRGFMSKVGSTYSLSAEVGKVTPSEVARCLFGDNYNEYAMEFIAGYKAPEDTRYVALIKADGNWGSVIFSSSATFSDYVDRSFKLDYGVKKAFYETLLELAKAEVERQHGELSLTSRVLSGVLYIGGDDITILVPSVVAVPFAVKFFEKAKEFTGFTFKVGVVSIKPDHPIQFAFQATDALMEESKIKPDIKRPEGNKTSIGCMVFSSTLASRSVVESEIHRYKRPNSPSYLAVSNDVESVRELLKLAGLYEFKDVVALYYSDKDRREAREKLRVLEDVVGYAEVRVDSPNGYLTTLAYILRQIARSDDGYDKEVLKRLVAKKNGQDPLKGIPLYDYFFVLKTFRVGVG
ncbi:HD domain-containing protein [Stygiolobus caldivivus]|uniref:Phosphohydrolase n=1 Tax=Stygiolobus caldivivus TaxID=2824673 RepID=A0A8D5U6C0_9CREN|nr:HD domain-containing protein [Stygiolobus caldivivus]BCU70129.1 phosphohydrolase [Stygiolobus caldivivus]